MSSGFASSPDPYVLRAFGASDNFAGISWKDTNGLSRRSPAIDPALKTLVLITSGQSLWANICPTLYIPVNAGVIDQMNIYDGALYGIGGPLLGSSYVAALGPGNITARLADLLVANGKFDRVIVVSTAIGSTTASMWADATGDLYNRVPVAMARLADRGIVPGMPGVTFACIWGLGESDNHIGTSQAAFTASGVSFLSKLHSTGFKGRIFIPRESWILGATSNAIRAAQAALMNGTTVFSGGNLDSLTAASRQADNTHWNDLGAVSAALLVYNAVHATGSPY